MKRTFDTGATRDTDAGKLDYEGFLSPRVLIRFAQYMDSHRFMADGTVRESDNWQKGIPLDAYMKSAWRHFIDLWCHHRGVPAREDLETALCALLFNIQGYLHEILKQAAAVRLEGDLEQFVTGDYSNVRLGHENQDQAHYWLARDSMAVNGGDDEER